MGFKYEASNPEGIHFTTSTIVQWIDLFTRRELQEVVIDSLKYCQREKGLIIFAWSLMPSHLHMISTTNQSTITLPDIMRDFKKHTSKALVKTIDEINESRQDWLMSAFEFAGRINRKIKDYKVWQDGYHPEEIITQPFLDQKLNYIHYNAVEAGFVAEPHHYALSSAIDYAGGKGLIDVVIVR
ncbi:MAG TPA: transposase [Chitinophagales bacterium]|nr:transposase [Chitinophagales bacterium]